MLNVLNVFAVHTIVERLKEKTNNLLKDADNLYKTALIKLPMAVRKMNWIEYSSKNVFVIPHFIYYVTVTLYFFSNWCLNLCKLTYFFVDCLEICLI